MGVNKISMKCQQCKGVGALWHKIKKGSTPPEEHYALCLQTGCVNGLIERKKYYASWGLHE